MMPSSAAYTCPSNPYRCLIRVVMAMAHGSCTRLPYGAFFILAAFDDQLTVVGNRSRGGALFGKQVGKIADGVVIQSVTT